MEERIVELEVRYTHLADLFEKLSDTIYAQQKEIDALRAELKRVRELAASGSDGQAMPHEKPPHY